MTMTAIGPVDNYAFLFRLQYSDTQYYRWADVPHNVNVPGDGLYTTRHPVIDHNGLGDLGPRIEVRKIRLTLGDPDGTYKRMFSAPNIWVGRLLDVFFVPSPGAAPRRLAHVSLRQRGFPFIDDFPVAVLSFGTVLTRLETTKQRLTNAQSQREVDPMDDSLDESQTTADFIWGAAAGATANLNTN